MPIVSIGTWTSGSTKKENASAIVGNWLAQGGRGVDTALVYLDQAKVAQSIADSGIARKDVFITTKIPGCAAAQSGIDSDLKQLNTDYIDLLLIHSPIGLSCPGTWKVLEDNVKNGKLKSIGVSNFKKNNLQGILKGATIKPAVNQISYSVFDHNEDTIQFCHANNITVEAYSPLGGAHGGKSVFKEPSVLSIAAAHNVSAAQVALRWIVQRGDVLTVLSSNKDHQANDADLWSFTLADDEMTKLAGIAGLVSDIVAKAPRKWADAVAPEPARDYKKMWEDFKVQYGKTYDSNGAEEARFAIFRTNVDYIEATNAQQLGYMLGVNQFADLTEAEVVEQYTGARKPGPLFESPYLGEHVDTDGALPDSVDWTAQGKVTPVKNQGHCGSCWAFSSTGALESANMIATGSLVSLSEQQLVDCHVDSGCSGGWPHDSFRYAESTAMCTESEYPYTAKDGSCHANSCTGLKRGAVTGYRSVAKTESDLRSAVAKGPVSITVQVAGGFHSYKSGVLSGGCSGSINHAVLAVGYGTEDGKKYWKVKNSWGASWGMDGYLLLQRGSGGQGAYCVLQDSPAYPVVASGPSPPTPPSPPSPPSPPTPPTPPTPPSPPSGQCHALSAVVTDQWCNDNCHAAAPYCPADLCRCDPSSLLV